MNYSQRVAAWLSSLPVNVVQIICGRFGKLEMISFWLLCWRLLVGTRYVILSKYTVYFRHSQLVLIGSSRLGWVHKSHGFCTATARELIFTMLGICLVGACLFAIYITPQNGGNVCNLRSGVS